MLAIYSLDTVDGLLYKTEMSTETKTSFRMEGYCLGASESELRWVRRGKEHHEEEE